MKMSMNRMAVGAAALAFVAGSANAQLEYYALATDGSLIYADGAGNVSVIGNVGLNQTINTLSLDWASRGGTGDFYTSAAYTNAAPFSTPSGNTYNLDVNTAGTSLEYNLSDTVGGLPFGGGIAHDGMGNVWQISQNFAGATTLTKHDADGNQISSVNVAITGAVGGLYIRSDGLALVGGNDGTIYTVNTATGGVTSANATGFAGLTEFSTGARAKDGFFNGVPVSDLFSPFLLDVMYGVTNSNGVANIWRINTLGNNQFSFQESIDLAALGVNGNVWGLQVVPTPASAALLGLGGLAATRRRRS